MWFTLRGQLIQNIHTLIPQLHKQVLLKSTIADKEPQQENSLSSLHSLWGLHTHLIIQCSTHIAHSYIRDYLMLSGDGVCCICMCSCSRSDNRWVILMYLSTQCIVQSACEGESYVSFKTETHKNALNKNPASLHFLKLFFL